MDMRGFLHTIGIEKGKPFAPDAERRKLALCSKPSLMSANTTLAPAFAKACAVARPMPALAPVTSARTCWPAMR